MQVKHIIIAIAALAGAGATAAQTSTTPATPSSSTSTTSSTTTSSTRTFDQDTIRQVQQALQGKGLYNGPVDGSMNAETTSALRQFQQSQGMTGASGSLDAQTLGALGVRAPAGSSSSTTPGSSSTTPGSSGSTSGSSSTMPGSSSTTPGTSK